jgi:type I restriction enzyme S subunit
LIIGRKGSIGNVHYSPIPCWPIDTTYFVEKSDNVDLKFYLYLLSFLKLGQLDKSTAVPGLSRNDYNAVVVKIVPLAEQQRIESAIEQQFTRLDAGVAALRKAQTKLKRYRAAVLKDAVEGKLTEAWRAEHPTTEPASMLLERILKERRAKWETDLRAKSKDPTKVKYVEPAKPDVEGMPDLPEGWCWATVEQVGDVQLGRQRAPQYHTGPYMRPYLRVANVFEDQIDISDILTVNFTPEEYEIYHLKFGDILLNEGQSLELIGRPAIYRDEVPGACFQNTLIRFRAYPGLLTEYALTLFRVYLHNQRFQCIGKHTTNIAHLGAGGLQVLNFHCLLSPNKSKSWLK